MPSIHAPPAGQGRIYSYPLYPFPWPEQLRCGDIYINQQASKDVVLSGSGYLAEVAVPESMINVGLKVNTTKDALSMVFTKPRWIETDTYGNVTRKFVPLFRNQTFSSEWGSGTKADAYIEYLGRPSETTPSRLLNKTLACNEPYHLLTIGAPHNSIGDIATTLWFYNLYGAEGPDFTARLYKESNMVAAGAEIYTMKEQPTGPLCAEPLAHSDVFSICYDMGMNVQHAGGYGAENRCTFMKVKYWDQNFTNPDTGQTQYYPLNTKCPPAPPDSPSKNTAILATGGPTLKGLSMVLLLTSLITYT